MQKHVVLTRDQTLLIAAGLGNTKLCTPNLGFSRQKGRCLLQMDVLQNFDSNAAHLELYETLTTIRK